MHLEPVTSRSSTEIRSLVGFITALKNSPLRGSGALLKDYSKASYIDTWQCSWSLRSQSFFIQATYNKHISCTITTMLYSFHLCKPKYMVVKGWYNYKYTHTHLGRRFGDFTISRHNRWLWLVCWFSGMFAPWTTVASVQQVVSNFNLAQSPTTAS